MNSRTDGNMRGILCLAAIVISVAAAMLWGCTIRPYQGSEIRRLTTQLQEGDDAARLAAIEELEPIVAHCSLLRCMDLSNIGATKSRPPLTRALVIALQDPKPEVRVAAAKLVVPAGAGYWISKEVILETPALVRQFAEDEQPEVRLAALHCCEHFFRGDDEIIPVLAKLTKDDDDAVRARAIDVLIHHVWHCEIPASAQDAMRDAAPAILKSLRADLAPSQPPPFPIACQALMQIRDRETQLSFLKLLNTPKGAEGISLWSTLGPQVDLETLLKDVLDYQDLLTHEEARLREAGIRLVSAAIGTTPESIPQITAAMSDPAGNVRAAAANAMIDAHQYDDAWMALEKLLDDPEAQVRRQAVAAYASKWVWKTERPKQIERLQRMAEEDPAEEVRDAAAKSVASLRQKR